MEDVEMQDITGRLHAKEETLFHLRTPLKSLSPVENMSKDAKLKILQQHVTKTWMQQQRRIDRVAKLQAEAKHITTTIHPIHVEVKQVVDTTMLDVLEHRSSEILKQVAKVKADVQ